MIAEYPLLQGCVCQRHESGRENSIHHEDFLIIKKDDSQQLLIPECVGCGLESRPSEKFARYVGMDDLHVMDHLSIGRFLCVDKQNGVVQISDDCNFASSRAEAFKFVRNRPALRVSLKHVWLRSHQFVLSVDSSCETSMIRNVVGSSTEGRWAGVSLDGSLRSAEVNSLEVHVGNRGWCIGLAYPFAGTSLEPGFDGRVGLELYRKFKVCYDFDDKVMYLED